MLRFFIAMIIYVFLMAYVAAKCEKDCVYQRKVKLEKQLVDGDYQRIANVINHKNCCKSCRAQTNPKCINFVYDGKNNICILLFKTYNTVADQNGYIFGTP